MVQPERDRRSDPRRGIVVRVGLVLTATGVVSTALDRRALAGAVTDLPLALGFGLAIVLTLLATLRRPPPGATVVGLGAVAIVLTLAAIELRGAPLIAIAYVVCAAAVMRYTAAHLRPLVVGALALWTPALWLVAAGGALEVISLPLRLAALVALGATLLAVTDPRRAHPSERLRWAGYGLLAIAIVSASMARTQVVGPAFALNDIIALAAALALAVLARVPMRHAARELAMVAIALVAYTALALAYLSGTGYGADAVAAQHRAAEQLLAGHDPYAVFDLPEALARFGLDPQLATHLTDGTVLRTYSYPALSFLAVAPFVWLGLDDIRWISFGVVLLVAAVAAQHLRPAWRPFALALVIGNEAIARQAIIAGVDPLWALLVLGAWITRRRTWLPAVLLGLALADRQPAWFVFPFVIAATLHERGGSVAWRRAAIAVAVAVLVNAPFVVPAPERAVSGILAPLFAPLVADGVGLMQLGVADRYTTALPRAAYTILALTALVALLGYLWRRPRGLAGAPLVWGLAPLWLAWRSLQNYFAFIPLFALVGDDEIAVGHEPTPPAPPI